MSRVGKVPVQILPGVKVDVRGNQVKVEGPKGKLSHEVPEGVVVKVENGQVLVSRRDADSKDQGALHGVTRTLISNMVKGTHEGFTKELDIVGVGYRANVQGSTLSLTVGYSHPVEYKLPEGVVAKVTNNTHLTLTAADKMLLGMVAAKIRGFKEPEPYQGKGIKYSDERIIRKQGKAAGAK